MQFRCSLRSLQIGAGALALFVCLSISSIASGQCPTWRPLPNSGVSGGPAPAVYVMTTFNGALIVGGEFWQAGPNTAATYIARFDPANSPHWFQMGNGFAGSPTHPNPKVLAMAEYNGELIIGGNFVSANGAATTVNHIARWNGTAWMPMPLFGTAGMNNTVRALAVYGGQLIAGGDFTTVGGQSISFVARWNGSTWQSMPAVSGFNSAVTCFTVHNGELIAGGLFTAPGARVARWNGTIWQSLPAGGFNNTVNALTVFNSQLYAGGAFTFVDGNPLGAYIARLSTMTGWDPMPGGGTDDVVNALAVHNGKLIVGGNFDVAGPYFTGHGVATFDPTVGWQPFAGVTGGDVFSLLPYEGSWLAGGTFTGAGGVAASRIGGYGAPMWRTATSGAFQGNANWTLGWAPIPVECPIFGVTPSATPYTVTFASPAFSQACTITNHHVIFNLGGMFYQPTQTIVGQLEQASLTVTNGTLSSTTTTVGPLGTLAGDGTIDGNVTNNGTLRPGNIGAGGGGTLTINGNYSQAGSLSRLSLQLEGARTPGVDYNTLAISGSANLGGTLIASITPPFIPQPADSFQVLTAGSINSPFPTVFITGLPSGVLMAVNYSDSRSSDSRGPGDSLSLVAIDYSGSLALDPSADSALSNSAADAVLADFNNDSFLDIAVVLPSIHSVAILLNDGGSGLTFTQQPLITVGAEPVSIVASPLDANASIDLAVVNRSDESVSILSNNGSGAFTVTQSISVAPHRPVALAAATLDPGGSIDLAVAVQFDLAPALDGVMVLKNNGSGSFSSDPIIEVAGRPSDIAAADLDDNGAIDLAITLADTHQIAILLNDGLPFGRGFAAPVRFDTGFDPRFVNPEDLDGDKDIDLVVGNATSRSLTILLNNGAASLNPSEIPTTGVPLYSTAADLDGDGDPELLIVVQDETTFDNVVRVFRNDALATQLTFSQSDNLNIAGDVAFVLAGDVDNDSQNDVITITDSTSGRASSSGRKQTSGNGGSNRGPLFNTVSMFRNQPEPNPCPADITPPGGDGHVTISDINAVLAAYGPCPGCPQDITPPGGDGHVTIADINAVLSAFGACP